ncbi:hypothetical protein CONPUDRAFT_154699 [Coniophora puteana RWD-64-598 SS2]|uniref:Uncharacterized protein n=1 Tax=Coniophora puteana (strain RWD-64-598) TaxID=741705 RepID=A0A5M3MNS7_CONPW|nr:uncharacterized protein CONPUDRAFT_154699 [Coniophora puteana RWD-64-598 SS2]EIW80687.1 hypothetical protein CONPUDRAFT_154699 [Coniophora puteana RWD-64-598 SS2]
MSSTPPAEGTPPPVASKAKRTQEQIRESSRRREALMEAISKQRSLGLQGAMDISEAYDVPLPWVSTQVFLGAEQQAKEAQPRSNAFGAFVKHIHATRVANHEENVGGSGAMVSASKVASEEWAKLSPEEKLEWAERSRQAQEQKASEAKKVVKKVRSEHIGNTIQGTFRKIDPVLLELQQATNCHICYIVTRNDVMDQYAPRSTTSKRLDDACLMLFKHTVEELSLRLDAYVAGGIAQLAAVTGERKTTLLRRIIREQILHRLCKLLQSRGISREELPAMVEWQNHEGTVIRWGVELVGYPGGVIKNPNDVSSVSLLQQIETAIRTGDCFWRELSDEQWNARKAAHDQRVLAGPLKAAGTKRRRTNTTLQPGAAASTPASPPTANSAITHPPPSTPLLTLSPTPSSSFPPALPQSQFSPALSQSQSQYQHLTGIVEYTHALRLL